MQKQINQPKTFPLRAACAYLVTLAVLFVLLLGAYALPGEPVRAQIARSVPLLQQEGLYPEFFGFKLFQMDNYTDTVMLFEAATADEAPPLTSMMTNTAYNVDNFETLPDDLLQYLEKDMATGAEKPNKAELTPFSYARYWHGYLIWLRPLLLVLTYGQIRVVLYLVLFALLGGVLVLLRRHCGLRAACWFGASQLLVAVFFVPHQLQFFTTFAIAYAGCLWLLYKPRRSDALCLALLVLGVVTAFCDLLVTPVLTVGLPLAVWLLRPEQRLRGGWPQCLLSLAGCLCWGTGYALCWATKWVAASLVTGADIVGDALGQIAVRTAADTWHGMELSWGNIIGFVYTTLQSKGLFWPLVVLAVLAVAVFVLSLRSRAALTRAMPLALVALLPPVWFAVLRTHSIQHGWFTWRNIAVTLFSGCGFLYYACGWGALKTRIQKKLQKKR